MFPKRLFIIVFFLSLVFGIAILRWRLVQPIDFIEGDGPAIAAGISRLCSEQDIGPYYFHPPSFSRSEFRAYMKNSGSDGELSILDRFKNPSTPPFYRYHSMTGVYFLGKLTCAMGEAAPRIDRICFIAGTLFPIFLALFLFQMFRPLPAIALPLFYLLIALSPELWISGSAYFNDKILAVCFLAFSLFILTYGNSDHRVYNYFCAIIAGLSFGLAVLMRLDTILFAPAIAFVALLPLPPLSKKPILTKMARLFLLFLFAGIFYLLVMNFMDGSIRLALGSSSGAHPTLANWRDKLRLILIAFGWGQLIVLIGMMMMGLGYLAIGIISEKHKRFSSAKSPFDRLLVWINSSFPLEKLLAILMLILPEIFFLFLFDFSSSIPATPKYLLFGASMAAGLCVVLPVWIWTNKFDQKLSSKRHQTAVLAFMLTAVFLPLIAGFIPFGRIGTADGQRYIGGWLSNRISIHRDAEIAKELVACILKDRETFQSNIVVETSSWMLEEAIAYEAASRGWQNRVVPTAAKLLDNRGRPVSHISLNEYVVPGSPPVSIFVPTAGIVKQDGNQLTDRVYARAVGNDFVYHESLNCFSK